LEYMKAILEVADATMDDVVKVAVLLTDMADFKAFNRRETWLHPPKREI
jgi:enamine deaminase RidA (YjgF/YER057c/UK114 family)